MSAAANGTMNVGEEQPAGRSSCEASGGSLTERLRRENSEQFLTLVRMHLSFVVDINTDDVDSSSDKPKQFRWGFSKKSKNTPSAPAPSSKCSEGSITYEGITKVYELIDFLLKEENVKQEGIFRRTGSLSRQQELKQLLMSGSSLGLDEGRFSVHDCASVLKGFLADLPQPLLMDQYYQTYCTLAVQYPASESGDSHGRLLTALQLLLLLPSPLHRGLLRRLLALLRRAADHECSNRMSPDTLATMFTPHLLCPRKVPVRLHLYRIVQQSASARVESHGRLLKTLQLLLLLPSPLHRGLLRRLLALLRRAADHECSNRMSPDTLATMFTPHLLCPRKVPVRLHLYRIVQQSASARVESHGRLLKTLQLLLLLPSPLHRGLLRRLLALLRRAADHECSNRMSPDTLATMFTPHLLCPRKVPVRLHLYRIVQQSASARVESHGRLLKTLQLLLLLPSPLHRGLLRRLLALLRRAADHECSNRMSPDTLATMFTPHLLCPRKVPVRLHLYRIVQQSASARVESHGRLLKTLQLLLLLPSPLHRGLLRRLLALLRRSADHECSNRMSPDTLATMFTPHLLCPRKVPVRLHLYRIVQQSASARVESHGRLLKTLQLLLLLPSPLHRGLLRRLLALLRRAADHECSNRMSPDTLATMFTPHLLCPRKVPVRLHLYRIVQQSASARVESHGRLLKTLQLLLLLPSPLHRGLLRRLLALLRRSADHECSNRMSPDTLATMFTPHLLCPRKLGPEALHSDAVALAPLVSFMIRQAERLFLTPPQLATDVAAYYTIRERKRLMSPDGRLDESIGDRSAASTVYTFVDGPRTRAENEANPTDAALAQLYAHIQALPDSQRKRRLVKQFNRQNGYGTPIQIQRTGKAAGSKSLGESIKRHIFHKGLLNKTPKKGSSGTISPVPEKRTPFSRDKLTLSGEDGGKTIEVSHKNIVLKNLANKMASAESLDDNEDAESDASNESTRSEGSLMDRARKLSPKFVSEPNLSILESRIDDDTPKNTRRGSRLFRSKVITATQNLNKKYAPKRSTAIRSTPTSCVPCVDTDSSSGSGSPGASVENIVSPDATGTPRLSRRDSMKQMQYRIFPVAKDETDARCAFKLKYLTSTPGAAGFASIEETTTPYFNNFRRASMSPITKSTQKLSKAMQESIMTPRSRKPLIITSEQRDGSLTIETKKSDTSDSPDTIYGSVSPKNDSDFVSSDESCQHNYTKSSTHSTDIAFVKNSDLSIGRVENCRLSPKAIYKENLSEGHNESPGSSSEGMMTLPQFKTSHEMSPLYLKECKTKSLSDPFREYLLSRSVLTATPVDLSLVNKSDELEPIGENISDSLMFCLDGNVPSDLTSSINNLAVDREINVDVRNGDIVRSPLQNLQNYINIQELPVSPSRKRSAADCDSYSDCGSDVVSLKKISMSAETIKVKNNLTSIANIDTSLWETDL